MMYLVLWSAASGLVFTALMIQLWKSHKRQRFVVKLDRPHRIFADELLASRGRPTRSDPLGQYNGPVDGVWGAREDEMDQRQKARDASWHWKAQYVHPPKPYIRIISPLMFGIKGDGAISIINAEPRQPRPKARLACGFASYGWDQGRLFGQVMFGWDRRLKLTDGWL